MIFFIEELYYTYKHSRALSARSKRSARKRGASLGRLFYQSLRNCYYTVHMPSWQIRPSFAKSTRPLAVRLVAIIRIVRARAYTHSSIIIIIIIRHGWGSMGSYPRGTYEIPIRYTCISRHNYNNYNQCNELHILLHKESWPWSAILIRCGPQIGTIAIGIIV